MPIPPLGVGTHDLAVEWTPPAGFAGEPPPPYPITVNVVDHGIVREAPL